MTASNALDLEAVRTAPLETDPFEHTVVTDFIRAGALERIRTDYPKFDRAGSVPLSQLEYGPGFGALIQALEDPGFEAAISEKFGFDLEHRPTMFTVRMRCRTRDGKIHTDSVTKIITVLIYLNGQSWSHDGGRLRLLRSGDDIDDYATEISPRGGTMLVFRRSDHSWHGHKPYAGPRRVVQMNWVTDESVVRREQTRHVLSAWLKRLKLML